MSQFVQSGTPINLSGSGSVSAVAGSLFGFYVNSTTSGTIVITDGGSAISGTITPAIGFHRFPAAIRTSCAVTIANTLDVTLFFAAG